MRFFENSRTKSSSRVNLSLFEKGLNVVVVFVVVFEKKGSIKDDT